MTTDPHVLVEARRLTEALVAQRTLVGSMFLVYVQNVYS